jgi:tetratricopeptide (TPR) repeat protein
MVELYTEKEVKIIESHIEKTFGKYKNVLHEIVSPDIHVDICVIEPTEKRNYYTLVTMGMGAHKMNVPPELKAEKIDRAELLITLPPDWDLQSTDETYYWAIRWLKIMARLPIEHETWLGWGHTVSNGEPFAENTELSGMLVTIPDCFGEKSTSCKLPNKDVVRFYQLAPLYEDEMQYKIENGAFSLLELFRLAFGNNWNGVVEITRKNVIEMALSENRSALSTIMKTAGYPYIYENLGRFLDSSHRYAEGVALLTEAIEKAPDNLSLYAMRGELYMGMNQPGKALDDLLHAITDVEALEDYWYMEIIFDHIGHLYEMFFADAESALKYYNLALECDGEDAYALSCIGDLHYYYLNQYQKAIDYYDAAIELEPDEAKRYLKRAEAYKSLNMKEKSENDYNVALEMYLEQLEDDPDDACLNCHAGECLLGLGKHEDSLVHLDKAISNAGNCKTCPPRVCHEAYFAICRYHSETGNKSKAEEYLKSAIVSSNAVRYNQFKIEGALGI